MYFEKKNDFKNWRVANDLKFLDALADRLINDLQFQANKLNECEFRLASLTRADAYARVERNYCFIKLKTSVNHSANNLLLCVKINIFSFFLLLLLLIFTTSSVDSFLLHIVLHQLRVHKAAAFGLMHFMLFLLPARVRSSFSHQFRYFCF